MFDNNQNYFIRRSDARGGADHGWLKTRHSFSFADYVDPAFMGFGNLRVINEDHIAGGGGFPPHPHRDMEIVTVVLAGELAHRDSLGNSSVIKPGDVQRMSAGSGIRHSEFNASETTPVHLMQIWILPDTEGGTPTYAQKNFSEAELKNRFRLIASHEGRLESVSYQQDMDLYRAVLDKGVEVKWDGRAGRALWLQVAKGAVTITGVDDAPIELKAGDALAVRWQPQFGILATEGSDLLLFDQPE